MSTQAKRVFILAGPNGAGKTTFAREYLPAEAHCVSFINADLIAEGLSPFRPEQAALRAGRLMLELIEQYVARGESFGFETTLATKNFARSIPRWQALGYIVSLYFLSLPSVEQAIQRVARRVRQGGHAVPADVVRRRFVSGLENLEQIYKGIVDEWVMLDNSGPRAHHYRVRRSPVNAPTGTNPEQAKRLEGILAAARRARRKAEDLAIATGTEIVESHNGAVVLISPSEILARRKKADEQAQGNR